MKVPIVVSSPWSVVHGWLVIKEQEKFSSKWGKLWDLGAKLLNNNENENDNKW